MKIMMLTTILVFSTSVFAITPKEMAAEKDWNSLSKHSFATITNYVPKANMPEVYAACLANSNYWSISQLVVNGYTSTLEQGYADLKACWPNKNSFGAAFQIAMAASNHVWQLEIAEAASKASIANLAFASNVLKYDNKIKTDEAECLRISSEALARGDYITAATPFIYWPYVSKSCYIADETEELKAWREKNASAVMTGLISMEMDKSVIDTYRMALFNLSTRDLTSGDKSSTYAMGFFKPQFFKDEYMPMYWQDLLTNYAFGRAMYDTYMANSTNANLILNKVICIRVPTQMRIDEIKKWWNKIEVDPIAARKAAIMIKDNDKLLTALVSSVNDMTVDDVNSAIEMVVALDADYRTSEVVRVLKNINAKYTLKLYDDRDTWEPLLSKIRALIDTRM